MIKHIVMRRLKAFAEGEDKAENAVPMEEILDALPAKIPEIKRFEVVLNAEFDSVSALESYQENDDPLKAAEFIQKVREDRAAVDYVPS